MLSILFGRNNNEKSICVLPFCIYLLTQLQGNYCRVKEYGNTTTNDSLNEDEKPKTVVNCFIKKKENLKLTFTTAKPNIDEEKTIAGPIYSKDILLPKGKCGLRLIDIFFDKPKNSSLYLGSIAGGFYARQGTWPWQALLVSSSKRLCGGVLISPRWIVTAAHCINGIYITVYLGMTNRTGNQRGSTRVYSREMHIHPGYINSSRPHNDIALIKLETRVAYSNFIYPACLLEQNGTNYADYECYISGFGATAEKNYSLKLNQRKVSVLASNMCYYNILFAIAETSDSDICINYEGNVNACSGDSGSPLSCLINGVFYTVGIASFIVGDNCTAKAGSDVYTDVSIYHKWIQSTIKKHS